MKSLPFSFLNFKELIIALIIIATTLSYYLDTYIPEGLTEVKWFNIIIKSYDYEDVQLKFYVIKMKIYIIALCTIWYLTSNHWWKSSILVIITIEILKLISAFNPNQLYMDELEYYSSLPICIPIILLLIFVSHKLNNYNLAKEVRTKIDHEIDDLFFEIHKNELDDIEKLKNNFMSLKKSKAKLSPKDYIKKLLELRNSFHEFKTKD